MALYDAFISYSHSKDKPIAAALQSVIQKLGKPWYRRRALPHQPCRCRLALDSREARVIDLPYSSNKSSDTVFLEDLAMYDANVLALAHGRQAQAAPYCALIKSDIEAFHDATEAVAKAYLATAHESFHDD